MWFVNIIKHSPYILTAKSVNSHSAFLMYIWNDQVRTDNSTQIGHLKGVRRIGRHQQHLGTVHTPASESQVADLLEEGKCDSSCESTQLAWSKGNMDSVNVQAISVIMARKRVTSPRWLTWKNNNEAWSMSTWQSWLLSLILNNYLKYSNHSVAYIKPHWPSHLSRARCPPHSSWHCCRPKCQDARFWWTARACAEHCYSRQVTCSW